MTVKKKRKAAPTKVVSVRLPADAVARLLDDARTTRSTLSELVTDAIQKRTKRSPYPCAAALALVVQTLAKLEEQGKCDVEVLECLERSVARLTNAVLAELR